MSKYLDRLARISESDIPNLDEVVLWALELFSETGDFSIPEFPFRKPVIIGSGNAKNTIRIIYHGQDAVFADENDYKTALDRPGVDGVIIYSASGGKHAPIIAKYAMSKGLEVRLVTCNAHPEAEKILPASNITVTPKNREPYTYNTSTYMGWILANTKENPREIIGFIEDTLSQIIPDSFAKYTGFLLVIPDKFAGIAPLLEVKFIELFGRNIARDVKTYEEMKHAITVVPCPTELCIQFGEGEFYFEGDILRIPLPETLWLVGFMATWYYTVGKIQEQMPPHFREHIGKYIENLQKSDFGNGTGVIV